MKHKKNTPRIVNLPSPHIDLDYCRFGHDYQMVKDWYEDLNPASTTSSCCFQIHKIILVCRRCGNLILKQLQD